MDEEFNLADPKNGAEVVMEKSTAQPENPRIAELESHWSQDIELSNARWIWIKFAKPSWIMSVKIHRTDKDNYPSEVAGFYTVDEGNQIISLFEERKIMLTKDETFVERGIAPVFSDNIILMFPKFNMPDKPFLPTLKEIEVNGYFDE